MTVSEKVCDLRIIALNGGGNLPQTKVISQFIHFNWSHSKAFNQSIQNSDSMIHKIMDGWKDGIEW